MRGAGDALDEVRDDLLAGMHLARTLMAQNGQLGIDRRADMLAELDRRVTISRERVGAVQRELRSGGTRRRPTDTASVREALDEVSELLARLLGDRLPALHAHVPKGAVVAAHPCAVRAVLLRLLQHACEAAEAQSPIQLSLDVVPDGVSVYVAHQSRHAAGYGALSVFERQHLDIDSLTQLGPDEGVSLYALQCLVEMADGYIAVGRSGSTVTVRVTLPAAEGDTTVVLPDPTVASPPA